MFGKIKTSRKYILEIAKQIAAPKFQRFFPQYRTGDDVNLKT